MTQELVVAESIGEKTAIPEIVSEVIVPASTTAPNTVVKNAGKAQHLQIEFAPASAAGNARLVTSLVSIVNAVYTEKEGNIFVDGYQRTNADDVRKFIREGELGVAYLPSTSAEAGSPAKEREAIGCIRVQKLSDTHGEFGMMAVDARYHGGGLGRDMVLFAEEHCRNSGLTVMQLELLVPQDFEHAFKKRLQEWYLRMGYKLVRLGVFQTDYPQLVSLLRGPCEYRVYEKPLV
jgi:GNAT superfamily N-acetyltransferase